MSFASVDVLDMKPEHFGVAIASEAKQSILALNLHPAWIA